MIEHFEGELLDTVSNFFKALGNETRLKILWQLSQKEWKPTDLAAVLEMTPSAISHQLTLLKNLKIVGVRREGKHQIYRLADSHISHVLHSVIEHYEEDTDVREE